MIKVTKQQRDNLLDAMNNMWPSIPPENVTEKLSRWLHRISIEDGTTSPTCETIACFGGWCAWWPAFRAQGVHADWRGAPQMPGINTIESNESAVCQHLFGYPNLFNMRGHESGDSAFKGNDHALVTRRMEVLLNNSRVGK